MPSMNRKLCIVLLSLTCGCFAHAEESCESGSCASGLRSPSLLQTGAVSRSSEEQEQDETREGSEVLHTVKQREWAEAHTAAVERLNAVKLIDSGLAKADPAGKVKEHGQATAGHSKTIKELDDNEVRRKICAKCTAKEEAALVLVLAARDAHVDAQKKSQAWLEATQLHEKTTEQYNQQTGKFGNLHEAHSKIYEALSHASATADFAKVKSLIDELHKEAMAAQALGVKMEKHRVARVSAKSVYDAAASKAEGADKLAQAASKEAREACAPLGIKPTVSWSAKQGECYVSAAQINAFKKTGLKGDTVTHNPVLRHRGGQRKTFAACKAECLKTKGCRGVEYDKLNLKNPSEGGNEWCWLAWGVDMSAGKKNSWTCHTLLIDGTQPVISAESPEALMA